MKNLMIGFVLGIFTFLFLTDVIRIAADDSEKGTLLYELESYTFVHGLGLWKPLTGRCTKELRGDYKMRDYFDCNRLQNSLSDLIYNK
jgi:hypothetical protein